MTKKYNNLTTEEQKNKLTSYTDNMGISASTVVKMLLSKEGII